MPIKNYTTEIGFAKSIAQIQVALVGHGAEAIMINYSKEQIPESLSFQIESVHGKLAFRLPANIPGVRMAMKNQGLSERYTNPQHSARVAWRIVRDWVEAQMAILEAEMVKMDEIFLPYLLTDGKKTLYDYMVDKGFPQLGAGDG